jgi:hypothetical protein
MLFMVSNNTTEFDTAHTASKLSDTFSCERKRLSPVENREISDHHSCNNDGPALGPRLSAPSHECLPRRRITFANCCRFASMAKTNPTIAAMSAFLEIVSEPGNRFPSSAPRRLKSSADRSSPTVGQKGKSDRRKRYTAQETQSRVGKPSSKKHDNQHDAMTLTLRTIYEYPNGTGQIVLEEGRADLWTFFMEQQEIVYPEQVVSPDKTPASPGYTDYKMKAYTRATTVNTINSTLVTTTVTQSS